MSGIFTISTSRAASRRLTSGPSAISSNGTRLRYTVNDFYIVTNGSATSRSEEFIEACAALYEYQEEKEQDSGHMLEMSDDRFHDPAEHAAHARGTFPVSLFRSPGTGRAYLSVYREAAATVRGFRTLFSGIYLTEENYVYGDLCLNAEGMVLCQRGPELCPPTEHALCPCGN